MQTIRTNLKNNASTQYTNYNFTSMCVCNGKVLGAGPDGLFRLGCEDQDNGAIIEAYFTPVKTDLGIHNEKRIDQAYLGFKCDGSLGFEITGEDDETIGPYLFTAKDTSYQTRRTTPGRGFYWTYVSLKITNINGSNFSINKLDLLVQSKTHGTK